MELSNFSEIFFYRLKRAQGRVTEAGIANGCANILSDKGAEKVGPGNS
jgi:hypothetical protein